MTLEAGTSWLTGPAVIVAEGELDPDWLAAASRGRRLTAGSGCVTGRSPARPVSSDTGAPRSDASSTSAMCAMAGGLPVPAAAIAAQICRLQPGLAEMTSGAPVASTEAALRAPSSPGGLGLEQVVHARRAAAGPRVGRLDQLASPGMPPSSSRGWRRMPCACPRWQASW